MDTPGPPALERQAALSLWGALRPWRRRVLLATALLILSKLAAVGVPGLLRAIVDRLTPGQATAALALPVGLLIGYALLRYASTLFTELRDLVFARVGKQVVSHFTEEVFARLLLLSPRFHSRRQTGALVREVERGTGGLAYLLGAGLFTVLPTALEFAAVFAIVSIGYGARYALLIAGSMLAYAAWTAWQTRKRVEKQRRMNEHDSRAHGLLVDTLLNYEAVKTHGREASERARYADVLSLWVEGSVSSQKTLSLLHLGQAGLIAFGVAGVMLLAGSDTAAGRISVGELVMINAYLIQVFLPLNTLGLVFRETRDALLNTEALFALLRRQPEIRDAPGARALDGDDTTVRFEQIHFGYEPGRPILQGLTLEIPQGQTCAVVGASGSGKSTLARLLMRLYEPDSGRVLIGGQDLREVTQQSLRELIGVVPQDPVLFDDSIAYNIAYGRPGASSEEIAAAARAAQAEEFIKLLPEGYATRVGERGARLSGGEKQRIAIARAFLKNPPIMVLDEATSALDTRAERAIQGALIELARDRTALIIAHRLSTIVDADEIIVMDRGRIAERGDHEALLARQGLYAQLWELQRQQQQARTLERHITQQPVHLAGLLLLCLDSLRERLAAAGTELFTRIDLDAPAVAGDTSSMARILQRVCELALHGSSGGRMEARLAREARIDQVSLRYQGQLDAAVEVPDTLELRNLVSEAGGHLSLQRDPAAGMQRVQLDFPLPVLAPVVSEAALQELPAAEAASLSGLHLMCIDDDEDALSSLALLLEQQGARTELFRSGHEALAQLKLRELADWPDALLCDIALDHEDGHTVIRQLRALEAQREIALDQRLPAVALTGMAQPEDRLRALAAGFQRHLAKPVPPDELLRVLRRLVRVRP